MRKQTLAVVGGLVAVVILVFIMIRDRPAGSPRPPAIVSPPAVSEPAPSPALRIDLPPDRPAARGEPRPAAGRPTGGDTPSPDSDQAAAAGFGPVLAQIPADDKPLVRVNGLDLTVSKIFPPGVMRPGDKLPGLTLDKFLEDAVNRALVVQEAERRGFTADPDYLRHLEELRGDLADLPNMTPEQRAWQFDEIRDMALMDRLYQEEGIVPRRLAPGEIEAHYAAHAADYDWVRKRETLKGSPPDRIERRVREEVRKDLQIPIRRELSVRREAFTATLRASAKVEFFAESANP